MVWSDFMKTPSHHSMILWGGSASVDLIFMIMLESTENSHHSFSSIKIIKINPGVRIHDISDSDPDSDPDPDPTIIVIDLQDANKKLYLF